MLKVKKLDPRATLPTVGHPGEDLAFDLYALDDHVFLAHETAKIRTGVAAHFDMSDIRKSGPKYGLLLRDRSSMAAKGFTIIGGVIDAGYRGEIIVLMQTKAVGFQQVKAGDKIAQAIPLPALTGTGVVEVESFDETSRGEDGFGSTGQ